MKPKHTERIDFTLISPQPALPNQQHERVKRKKLAKSVTFAAVDCTVDTMTDWHSETL